MSAEILEDDGIVYVGAKPWHGLGIEVDPNITAHEAMMQAKLDWNVEKVPLLYQTAPSFVGEPVLRNVDGHVGIKRMDTQRILGVTTPRYEPFQNADGFEVFQQVLDTGMAKIETAGSLKNGRIVWALARIQSEDLAVTGNDLIRPYVLLSFGHDGKRGIKFGFTPIRVVCWNTLSASDTNEASRLVRVAHKGDVKGNVQMLVKALDLTVQEFRATLADYRKMLNTPINQDDLREYVRVSLQLVEKDDNKRATNLINRVTDLAITGKGNAESAGTLWAGFNAVTEYLSHGAGRSADNRYSSLWFGNNKLLLQGAYDEAMRRVA